MLLSPIILIPLILSLWTYSCEWLVKIEEKGKKGRIGRKLLVKSIGIKSWSNFDTFSVLWFRSSSLLIHSSNCFYYIPVIFLPLFPFSWQGFSHFSSDYQAGERETEIWSLCDSTFFRPFQKSILERILPSFLPWYWSQSLRLEGIRLQKTAEENPGKTSLSDEWDNFWWERTIPFPIRTRSLLSPFSLSPFFSFTLHRLPCKNIQPFIPSRDLLVYPFLLPPSRTKTVLSC